MMSFVVPRMFIGFLVVAVVVAIAVSAVIYFARSGRSDNPSTGDARQVLDRRYARGEIGKAEYKHIRRELG